MNIKLIDGWTFLHIIVAFVLTRVLLSRGFGLLLIVFIIVIFEIIEHSFVGDVIFNWTETERQEVMANSIIDVIAGLIGVFLAYSVFRIDIIKILPF